MSLQDLLRDDEKPNITDENLGVLGDAAGRLVKKQKEIAAAEEALKNLKAEERKISQEEIPNLMDAIGVEKITLRSGHVLSVTESIQCAIPAPKQPKAYSWLDEHGHGDLIKAIVSAKFGRGDRDTAELAVELLNEKGIIATLAESVHPGTLKAWAREELARGRALPDDLFKVHIVRQSKVS